MRLKSVLTLLAIILLFVSPVFAEEVCFNGQEAGQVLVEIEKYRSFQEEVELLKETNTELQEQVRLLKEINQLQKEQIKNGELVIEQYKDIVKFQKDAYGEAIKDSKPSSFRKFMDAVGFLGIGILIGLALL